MVVPIMGYVAAASSSIPAIVGLSRCKQLNREMKLFTALIIILCVNVALELILGALNIKNYLVSEIYLLIEVPFFGYILRSSVSTKITRRIIEICVALYVILWFIDEMFYADPNLLNNISSTASRIVLILMCSVALNASLKSVSTRLAEEPMFWVLTGTILYSSGSFVVFALSNELLKLDLTYFIIGWYVNWILFIITNLLYSRGLLCKPQA